MAIAAVFGLAVLGVGAYVFSAAAGVPQAADPLSEAVLPESVTDVVPPKQIGAPIPAEVKSAPAVVAPVATYSAGCTSAFGRSATTGASCDGSAVLTIVTPSELPSAKSGQSYAVAINTSGGPGTPVVYTWSVKSDDGALPVPGLRLSAKYGNSVSVVGTPADMYFSGVKTTLPVTFTISLTATAGTQSATKTFKLKVEPSAAGS